MFGLVVCTSTAKRVRGQLWGSTSISKTSGGNFSWLLKICPRRSRLDDLLKGLSNKREMTKSIYMYYNCNAKRELLIQIIWNGSVFIKIYNVVKKIVFIYIHKRPFLLQHVCMNINYLVKIIHCLKINHNLENELELQEPAENI